MRRAQSMLALVTAFAMDSCTAGSRTGMATPDATLFDGGGYRVARYRAPVAGAPSGVANISTAEVRELSAAQESILIDVMPAEGGHRDPHTGRWRLAVERLTLPGSH